MANQIGHYYRSLPNRAEALTSTATHLRRFWEPRMRKPLLEHFDGGGVGLEAFTVEAIREHRGMLEPVS